MKKQENRFCNSYSVKKKKWIWREDEKNWSILIKILEAVSDQLVTKVTFLNIIKYHQTDTYFWTPTYYHMLLHIMLYRIFLVPQNKPDVSFSIVSNIKDDHAGLPARKNMGLIWAPCLDKFKNEKCVRIKKKNPWKMILHQPAGTSRFRVTELEYMEVHMTEKC